MLAATTSTAKDATIRLACESDAEAIREIYAPYVLETCITFETHVPSVSEFRARIARTLESHPYFVAELDGEVVGYCYAGFFRPRTAYRYSIETSVYLRGDIKGGGLGRRLYELLEEVLRMQGVTNAYACIASSEPPCEQAPDTSRLFHKHLGYKLVGTFRKCGYKFDRWFDMIWMEKMLVEGHSEPYREFVPFPALDQEEVAKLIAQA
ncbi:MAG: GNAT family N-acetyltransferase [Coriobacteriia bacterium]|nr:GNAT family N-acetyltransferase [Coriobacteriia bacterium]